MSAEHFTLALHDDGTLRLRGGGVEPKEFKHVLGLAAQVIIDVPSSRRLPESLRQVPFAPSPENVEWVMRGDGKFVNRVRLVARMGKDIGDLWGKRIKTLDPPKVGGRR